MALIFFFFQAEDGIRDKLVTGVQTCALPICRLELKYVCSRGIHKRDLSWLRQPVEITADWKQVVRHPEVDIVVELVGELTTARAIAQAALDAGKHLVTANKQLVAEYGKELVERSRAAAVSLGI